jgi:hypothetical protein
MIKYIYTLVLVFIFCLVPCIMAYEGIEQDIKDLKFCESFQSKIPLVGMLFKDDTSPDLTAYAPTIAKELKDQKPKAASSIYTIYGNSQCFREQIIANDYDKIKENLASIQQIEAKAGVKNKIQSNYTDNTRDISEFVAVVETARGVHPLYSTITGTSEYITRIANPFHDFELSGEGVANKVLSALLIPPSTPKFLAEKGVNLQKYINWFYIVLIIIIVVSLAKRLYKYSVDEDESVFYDCFKIVVMPVVWSVVAKLSIMIFFILANISTSIIFETGEGCKAVNGQYTNFYCNKYKETGDVCLKQYTPLCNISESVQNNLYYTGSFVNTTRQNDVIGTKLASIIPNWISYGIVFLLFLYFAYLTWRITKSILDIGFKCIFYVVMMYDEERALGFISDMKNEAISYVVKMILFSIVVQICSSLISSDVLGNLMLFFGVLGLGVLDVWVMRMLGVNISQINMLDSGRQEMNYVAGRYSYAGRKITGVVKKIFK